MLLLSVIFVMGFALNFRNMNSARVEWNVRQVLCNAQQPVSVILEPGYRH